MRSFRSIVFLLLVSATAAVAADNPKPSSTLSFDQTVDRVVEREPGFVVTMKRMHPLAETYIQNLHEDSDHNVEPASDQYFLGRLDLNGGIRDAQCQRQREGFMHHVMNPISDALAYKFLPQGFAQMAVLDSNFQKNNYHFTFVRREFLGEARCIVIDVQPVKKGREGLFTGRIWVEDHDFNIVRFNGTYSNRSNYDSYFHFDSWRMNMQPGIWLPSYVYSEETSHKHALPPFIQPRFKAQTRFWDYDEVHIKHQSEFTDVRVDLARDNDEAIRAQATPLEAQRDWERLAE